MHSDDARRAALVVELWSTAHQAERAVAQELAAGGVEGEQLNLLLRLALAPDPVTPTSLARDLGVPFTTLRHALLRLIARGDAERVPNPRDQRSYLVALSAQGRGRAQAAIPALTATTEALARRLGGDQTEATAALRGLRLELAALTGVESDTTTSL